MNVLDRLSIPARHGVGIISLAWYCDRQQLTHPQIDAFIAHGFAMATATDLGVWDQQAPELVGVGLGSEMPAAVQAAVDESGATVFIQLLREVMEIAYSNIYGATTDASKRHLLSALAIARAEHVLCPDFPQFLESRFDQRGGWGNPVSSAVLAAWMSLH